MLVETATIDTAPAPLELTEPGVLDWAVAVVSEAARGLALSETAKACLRAQLRPAVHELCGRSERHDYQQKLRHKLSAAGVFAAALALAEGAAEVSGATMGEAWRRMQLQHGRTSLCALPGARQHVGE